MQDTRPSKKQRELFAYIDSFIKGNGYGPSYREVMRALDYKSVSTVAVHVDALIAHGLLRKKDNSARSLEVVLNTPAKNIRDPHIEWLERELKKREADGSDAAKKEAAILKEALEIVRG
jgi:SOS-response transcriptional repressor LexA